MTSGSTRAKSCWRRLSRPDTVISFSWRIPVAGLRLAQRPGLTRLLPPRFGRFSACSPGIERSLFRATKPRGQQVYPLATVAAARDENIGVPGWTSARSAGVLCPDARRPALVGETSLCVELRLRNHRTARYSVRRRRGPDGRALRRRGHGRRARGTAVKAIVQIVAGWRCPRLAPEPLERTQGPRRFRHGHPAPWTADWPSDRRSRR